MSSNDSRVFFVHPTFTIIDYIIFSIFLMVSAVVGIIFSIRGHKNSNDYLFGGRQLGSIPIGISNGVSFMSAIALIGYPAEFYVNGVEILFASLTGVFAFTIGGSLIARMIYPLNMTSLTEYFAKRFKSKLLIHVANITVLICILEYMGACMLGSIIALNSATGGQVSVIVGLVIAGLVGTFYTTIGGLKAVVWTDVIQCGFMLSGISAILIKAILDTPGGFTTTIEMNYKYERIHPLSFSINPTIRHTFWGVTVGKFFYLIMWPIQPSFVQRICSTKTQSDSYKVAGITSLIFSFMSGLPMLAGMAIFGYYASRDCDIFKAGWVKGNEIVMYFARERLNYPGFQGFFIASLFSGSLSSFSSGLNAASAILWKDTIKPLMAVDVSEMTATMISKLMVVIFGVVSMVWCYALYMFGGLILQLTQSINTSMYGAYCGLFFLAIFFRSANYFGALVGVIISFSFTLWISLGTILHGNSMDTNLPSTTSLCHMNYTNEVANISISLTTPSPQSNYPVLRSLYSVSYIWLPTICVVTSIVVSLFFSCLTRHKISTKVQNVYLFPLCRNKEDYSLNSSIVENPKETNCMLQATDVNA